MRHQRAPNRQYVAVRPLFSVALALSGMIAPLMITGCSTPSPPFPNLPRLAVSTRFKTENLCDAGISPKIALGNVPNATARYLVQITDISVLLQTPWREVIPASSKAEIPEGAAKTYIGPCIGDNLRFDPVAPLGYVHRVEVLAEDKDGRPLAYGTINIYVESPYLTAKGERFHQQQGGAAEAPVPVAPPSFSMDQTGTFPGSTYPGGIEPNTGIFR